MGFWVGAVNDCFSHQLKPLSSEYMRARNNVASHRIASHKHSSQHNSHQTLPKSISTFKKKVQSSVPRTVQSKSSPVQPWQSGQARPSPACLHPNKTWKSPSQSPETHYRSALCHGHCTSSLLLSSCLPTRQIHSRYPLPAFHQH